MGGLMPNQIIQDPNKKGDPNSFQLQWGKSIAKGLDIVPPLPVVTLGPSERETKIEGLNFPELQKAFNSLKSEYEGIGLLLNNNTLRTNKLVNIDRLKALSDELYSQGLNLLTPIIDLKQQLDRTDIGDLEEETKELALVVETGSPRMKALLQERLEKNTNSLKLVKGFKDRINELLCQVKLCRESIREIRLELPEILNHTSSSELEKVMLELQTRVSFAQRVRNEYIRQGV
jgi:hypothetical protein